MKEEYTVKEIADLLGVSQVSIRRKIQSGEIKAQPTPKGKDPNKATKKIGASDLWDYLKKHPSQIASITNGTVMVAVGSGLPGVAVEIALAGLIGVLATRPAQTKANADELRVSSQEIRRMVERKKAEQSEKLDSLQKEMTELEKKLDEVDATILRCNWVIDQLDSVVDEEKDARKPESENDDSGTDAMQALAKALTVAAEQITGKEKLQKGEQEKGSTK